MPNEISRYLNVSHLSNPPHTKQSCKFTRIEFCLYRIPFLRNISSFYIKESAPIVKNGADGTPLILRRADLRYLIILACTMLLSRFLSIPLRPDFLFPDRFFYSARTFLVVGGCTSEHSLDRIFYSSARGHFNHIFCRHRNADYHRNADCRRTFCYHADRRRNACRRRSNPWVRSAAVAGGAADTKAEGAFPGWDNKPLSIPQ